jgi:tetratricopeptide (TPR) repeat protein
VQNIMKHNQQNGATQRSPYAPSLSLRGLFSISLGLAIGISTIPVLVSCAQDQSVAVSKPTPNDLRDHISQQIEKLGDANYSSRIRAQGELQRIGVLALDQLHTASFHPDPQIASTARFIVQSQQFTWSWETDPVKVRQILANYSAESDKSIYIDQLNRLEHDEGFGALCRLARYETRSGLAKRAALLLMRSKPTVGQSLASRKESLKNYVNGGQSTASLWIAQYANADSDFNLAWWEKTLADELETLKSGSMETNLEIVTDLHRWVVEQIFDQPNIHDKALELGRTILGLAKTVPTLESMVGNRSTRANEFAQWALKYKLPELVQEQHAKLPYAIVANEMMFGYLLAESFLMQENFELAGKVAEQSLNQHACSELGETKKTLEEERNGKPPIDFSARRSFSDQERRSNIGRKLQDRGRFEWAEAEFRLGINDDLTERASPIIMLQLSEMLQSQGKHLEAAKVLQPFVERYTSEPMFRRQVFENSSIGPQLVSYYHLYLADDARLEGDFDKAAKNYWKSLDLTSEDVSSINVDAIIGLYKTSLSTRDEEKRRLTLNKIVQDFRSKIRGFEEEMKLSKPSDLATRVAWLSDKYNTLAWVIVNTEGSKEEAIFLSRKACNLSPEHAEYLDTLAYCYAAMDRFQDAVQQQRKAVELKPHHPDLVKALQRFEAKLRSSSQTPGK